MQAFHFIFTLLAIVFVLIVMPALHRKQALELGLLTPWQLLKLVCGVGVDDPHFLLAGRVTQGLHHLLPEADQGVELPPTLPQGAFYHGVAPCSTSLLGS